MMKYQEGLRGHGNLGVGASFIIAELHLERVVSEFLDHGPDLPADQASFRKVDEHRYDVEYGD